MTACKTVGELCNLLAMTLLQQEDYNTVLELLKKAEILTEKGDGLGKRLFITAYRHVLIYVIIYCNDNMYV